MLLDIEPVYYEVVYHVYSCKLILRSSVPGLRNWGSVDRLTSLRHSQKALCHGPQFLTFLNIIRLHTRTGQPTVLKQTHSAFYQLDENVTLVSSFYLIVKSTVITKSLFHSTVNYCLKNGIHQQLFLAADQLIEWSTHRHGSGGGPKKHSHFQC